MKKRSAFQVLIFTALLMPVILYFSVKIGFALYTGYWADRLIELDSQGKLSTRFGAAWQEVVYGESYQNLFTKKKSSQPSGETALFAEEYPSISVVEKLNRVDRYSSSIKIEDRRGREIAVIRTDHRRVPYSHFPKTLVESACASEDRNFFTNRAGYEFDSFVRAALYASYLSITTGKKHVPKGTSTITQQVAKMFISQLDSDGHRQVSRTMDRKIREIRIASALRKKHTPQEIMEIYLNHCLTSSYGLVGAEEISRGLWGKSVKSLSDAEAVYLSRMVKWGENIPDRIKKQCRSDMPRIQKRLRWPQSYAETVLSEIEDLTFLKPEPITAAHPELVELANICWDQFLEKQGFSESARKSLNLLDPSSLIRKKGNASIRLTIDLPLQNYFSEQADKRGWADSVLITDIRIGSRADTVSGTIPRGSAEKWQMRILAKGELFSDPGSSYRSSLKSGDTLYTNIQYEPIPGDRSRYRTVSRFYRRGAIQTQQPFAYAAADEASGKLRAFVSSDRNGSRCASLFDRTAELDRSYLLPLISALLFDWGEYHPADRWDDRMPVSDSVAWARTLSISRDSGEAAVFAGGKRVANRDSLFHGDLFLWEHIRDGSSIFYEESLRRLGRLVYNRDGSVNPAGLKAAELFRRAGIEDAVRRNWAGRVIPGEEILRMLVSLVKPSLSAPESSSDSSETVHLTLLEQIHLFSVLSRGRVVPDPKNQLSLFLESVVMQGDTFTVGSLYPSRSVQIISAESVRPVQLALFTSLGTEIPDVPLQMSSAAEDSLSTRWITQQKLFNFGQTASTEPRRPFTYDRFSPSGNVRWGVHCGVYAADLGKFAGDSLREPAMIAVGAVGEWRSGMVPAAGSDGKNLHRFIWKEIPFRFGALPLQKKTADSSLSAGFMDSYRNYLTALRRRDSLLSAGDSVPVSLR